MNYTTRLRGGQMGLLNTAQDRVAGVQAAVLMNLSDQVRGMQIHCGIFGNGAVDMTGAQMVLMAGYNLTDRMTGFQMAMLGFNYVTESAAGTQFALFYNYARKMTGLQMGLVNVCETLSGVQVGLVNIIRQPETKIFPLVQFRF
jgi:hypothetical protein